MANEKLCNSLVNAIGFVYDKDRCPCANENGERCCVPWSQWVYGRSSDFYNAANATFNTCANNRSGYISGAAMDVLIARWDATSCMCLSNRPDWCGWN
jgi:hypothetical protein